MLPFLFFIEITTEHLIWLGGGVIGTLSAVAGIAAAKKNISAEIWQPFRERFITPRKTRRKKLDALIDSNEALKGQVSEILTEVKPNGGSSLRDSINRIEKHIDYANAKLRHQDEMSPDALFETDERAFITFANPAFCELLGADEQDVLDHRWLSRIPSLEERRRVLDEWSDAARNRSKLDIRHQFAVTSEKRVTVRVQATPRFNRSAELRGFFGKIKIVPE